jgi:prophage regulatory protein
MEKLLNEKEVSGIVSFQRTRLFEMINKGDFPKPIKFGRNNRWLKSEIESWLNNLKAV